MRLLVRQLASQFNGERLQACLHAVVECREQLMTVVGVNRELLLTDLLLRIERYLQPGATLPGQHF
jgi:DNA polymerase-3 subunit delta'